VNKIPDRLGIVVKSARSDNDLTLCELATRLKITSRYLIAIENGQQKPSYDVLFRLIRELRISADRIFYPE